MKAKSHFNVCNLCLRYKPLLRSHIVPEFFYKPMYDDKHRFLGMSAIPSNKTKLYQKGITERLLCCDCEQLLSKYERYASRVLYGGEAVLIKREKNILHVSNLDYHKFKLFLLSIIWRFSVNKNEVYKTASLGPHEDRIRDMIFREDPGDETCYPCMMTIVTLDDEHLKQIIIPPSLNKVEGRFVWRLVVGGLLLSFFISSHNVPPIIHKAAIKKDGTAVIVVQELARVEFLHKLMGEIAKAEYARG